MKLETTFLGKRFYFSRIRPEDIGRVLIAVRELKARIKAAAIKEFSAGIGEIILKDKK